MQTTQEELEKHQVEETLKALEALHVEQLDEAFTRLEELEKGATPAPWVPGHFDRSIVVTEADFVPCTDSRIVCESITPRNRDFIIALRNCATTLIRQCKNMVAMIADLDGVHEALDLPYNESAAEAVRSLKHLAGNYREAWIASEGDARRLRAENQALRARLAKHDGCSRWGAEDSFALRGRKSCDACGRWGGHKAGCIDAPGN